jgi:hypothetical protein
MARNLTAAVITEITNQQLRPVLFVQILFSSGYIYLWSGVGTLVAAMPAGAAPGSGSNQNWLGVGNFGAVSPIGETSDVAAAGISFSLSGIPSSFITSALGEIREGNPAFLWQAFLTAAGGVIVSPYQAWAGRLDACEITESADAATILLTAENRLIDLQRVHERLYEKQDQAIDFPADTGFDFVPSLQELSIVWGKATPTSAPSSPGGTFRQPPARRVYR